MTRENDPRIYHYLRFLRREIEYFEREQNRCKFVEQFNKLTEKISYLERLIKHYKFVFNDISEKGKTKKIAKQEDCEDQ